MNALRFMASAGLLMCSLFAHAADHRDGPLATGDPSADLNDVYTFINPNNPAELIIIGTTHPAAGISTRFSDAVEYRFHIDNGAANGTTLITCTFADDSNSVLCRSAGNALLAQGRIERTIDAGDLRVFAGLRDDPFFFDSAAFNRTRLALSPQFTNPGVNGFAGNIMSIVLGVKHARLTNSGANPILKIYASTKRVGDIGISAGHAGAWFDAANPGHGIFLHTLAADPNTPGSPRRLLVNWNVFNNQGQQLNIYGVGDINGDRASVPVITSTGGGFPPNHNAAQQVDSAFGRLDFLFNGCGSMSMTATPTAAGFSPVTVAFTRLTSVENLPCTLFSAGQIDRNGRPGINTALINLLANTGLKDAYNRAEGPPANWLQFQSEMQANLTALDTLDGISGNSLLPPATLASVLVDDRLIINTSIATCGAYLAVELGVMTQCGGRTLSRDVIDDTLGAVVGPGVSDFVGNDSIFLTDFPFVGPPL